MTNGPTDLEQRVRELERRLDRLQRAQAPLLEPSSLHPAIALGLTLTALGFGYLGVGLPQHPYQFLLAGLILLVAYHRGALLLREAYWRWPQIVVNYAFLCLLCKLLIGGGTKYPLEWLKAPTIKTVPPGDDASWFDRAIPDFEFGWETIASVSDWNFDMTRIQVLLLIVTLLGALVRFQPFASLTALILLIISVPTFFAFHWDWIILFLIAGAAALYLQTGTPARHID